MASGTDASFQRLSQETEKVAKSSKKIHLLDKYHHDITKEG